VTPSFTVVIPTHLRPDLLQKALESVIGQTKRDFECIVVGDVPAESRTIRALIADLADDRISYYVNENGTGANGSRNIGISHAQGELIAFLDDDDWWTPDKLERHAAMHAQTGAALVFSSACIVVDPGEKLTGHWRAPDKIADPLSWLVQGRCPATSSLVSVRRSVLEQSGLFDPDLISVQDWDLWLRVAEVGSFATITDPLIYFRQHQGVRTSRDPTRRLRGISQIEQKWSGRYDIRPFVERLRATVAIDAAFDQVACGQGVQGMKAGLAALWRPSHGFSLKHRVGTTARIVREFLRPDSAHRKA
jgi:glycosyltransferase involved in cell wall biosynthesis